MGPSGGHNASKAPSGGRAPSTDAVPEGRQTSGRGFTLALVDSGADVSLHGKDDQPMQDVRPEEVVLTTVGESSVKTTERGHLDGYLVCAATGRYLSINIHAYSGTGNAKTIWSVKDITEAGCTVTFGPGTAWVTKPGQGRFYLTACGHALLAHPLKGEKLRDAARRTRATVLREGWTPSRRMPPKKSTQHRRAPRQGGQGEAAAPRR